MNATKGKKGYFKHIYDVRMPLDKKICLIHNKRCQDEGNDLA